MVDLAGNQMMHGAGNMAGVQHGGVQPYMAMAEYNPITYIGQINFGDHFQPAPGGGYDQQPYARYAMTQGMIPNYMQGNVSPVPAQNMFFQNMTLPSMPESTSLQKQFERVEPSRTILDLNDDCLEAICQYLNEYELYALRDAHIRFAYATEQCYRKIDSVQSLVFDFDYWLLCVFYVDLVKILEYFGHCMTRARISRSFTLFVKTYSVTQSFLAGCLKNVRNLWLDNVDHDEVEFISTLQHIETLEVADINGWIPLQCHYSKLNTMRVQMYTRWCLRFDPSLIENLIAFLLRHKQIQRLAIDIRDSNLPMYRCFCVDREWEEKLLGTIATNMCDLIQLNVQSFIPNEMMDKIFVLDKLQALNIPSIDDIDLLKEMKNLTYLSIYQQFSVEHLHTIVEMVPTLTYLKLFHDGTYLDKEELDILIEKRKLSPHCENELLRIDYFNSEPGELIENLKRNEKYVSCIYIDDDTEDEEIEDDSDDEMNIGAEIEIEGIAPED